MASRTASIDAVNNNAPLKKALAQCPMTFDERLFRSAKAVDESAAFHCLYGALDGLSVVYSSTIKYACNIYSPTPRDYQDNLNEVLTNPSWLALILFESLVIGSISVLGNYALTKKNANELAKNCATAWPYMRDVLKGMKNSFKGVEGTLTILKALDLVAKNSLRTIALPVGLTMGAVCVINRSWNRRMNNARKECKDTLKNTLSDIHELNHYMRTEHVLEKQVNDLKAIEQQAKQLSNELALIDNLPQSDNLKPQRDQLQARLAQLLHRPERALLLKERAAIKQKAAELPSSHPLHKKLMRLNKEIIDLRANDTDAQLTLESLNVRIKRLDNKLQEKKEHYLNLDLRQLAKASMELDKAAFFAAINVHQNTVKQPDEAQQQAILASLETLTLLQKKSIDRPHLVKELGSHFKRPGSSQQQKTMIASLKALAREPSQLKNLADIEESLTHLAATTDDDVQQRAIKATFEALADERKRQTQILMHMTKQGGLNDLLQQANIQPAGFASYYILRRSQNNQDLHNKNSLIAYETKHKMQLLFSNGIAGIVDAPYLYVGVMGLALLHGALLIALSSIIASFLVLSVVCRVFEEQEKQRESQKSLLEMQLAERSHLLIKAQYAYQSRDAASNTDAAAALSKAYDRWHTTFNQLKDNVRPSYYRAALTGIKDGLSAFGALASVFYATSIVLMLSAVHFPPLLLAAGVFAGLVGVVLFASYRLYRCKQEIADFDDRCEKDERFANANPRSEELSLMWMDLKATELERDGIPLQQALEMARASCSGFGKSKNLADFTAPDRDKHSGIVLAFSALLALFYGAVLGLRALAKGFAKRAVKPAQPQTLALELDDEVDAFPPSPLPSPASVNDDSNNEQAPINWRKTSSPSPTRHGFFAPAPVRPTSALVTALGQEPQPFSHSPALSPN